MIKSNVCLKVSRGYGEYRVETKLKKIRPVPEKKIKRGGNRNFSFLCKMKKTIKPKT